MEWKSALFQVNWISGLSLYIYLLQADKLSLAFITGKSDSVMLRVDSAQSDFLQIALVRNIFLVFGDIYAVHSNMSYLIWFIWFIDLISYQAKGYLTMSYNLGTEDIIVYDRTKKLNDGNHHVVRLN